MVRVGEDASERLDVVPAEFFVHWHIRGKWAFRCRSSKSQGRPVQVSVEPQERAHGSLVAHTLAAHFVDHLPYYRIEQIRAQT